MKLSIKAAAIGHESQYTLISRVFLMTLTCIRIAHTETQAIDIIETPEGTEVLILNNTAVGLEGEALRY